ncbi:LysR substrate-binding domain-containing protein [Kineococcus sp. SYSU DK001]|uniref:LysR substrate-binding domain-containing protein n=1 Tax=Kineococcus sp. SYSU DK001 TaxID=3383122 RepID=UPI003D7EDD79
MESRELRVFTAVAEELHFGRAAERLSVAQPAVSQQVRRLERRLGLPLLTRTSRSVELTDAGRHLLRRSRAVLADLSRLEEEMADLRHGRAGRVGVGFVGTASYDLLPRLSRLVAAELPCVRLDLHGEQLTPLLLTMLLDRTIELAVVRNADATPGLVLTPLRTEPLVAVLPADDPLAGRAELDLASLRGRRFVVHPSGARSAMFTATLAACRAAGFTPVDTLEVRETSTLVTSVAAGLGVALVPDPVRSLHLDGVAYVPLAGPPVTTTLLLAHRDEELPPVVEGVGRLVVEAARH